MCVCVCVCVCVTKIYTVGCFNSSWSKTESFSHPLSKRICARKGRFLTRYLIALNKTGLKNWCFQTAVLKKIPESPLNCKRSNPVSPKRNKFWMFIRKTGAEAEAPILWPPTLRSWFIGKDPDSGKDWGQGEKGATEDEMVGCYHQLNGHEFKQIPRDSEGQRSLSCYSPWGHKELDTT